jgi:hypothetical protein
MTTNETITHRFTSALETYLSARDTHEYWKGTDNSSYGALREMETAVAEKNARIALMAVFNEAISGSA